MRAITLSILAAFALPFVLPAQSPIPVVVPATSPAATLKAPPAAPAPAVNADSFLAALKMLQEMKAANEETLRQQAATLEQLDELEKAAEQVKIYTKRN